MTAVSRPLQSGLKVNGEVISARDIAAEAQNHAAPPGKPGIAWKAAARALAVRALLLQEARRLGLSPQPRLLSPGRRESDEEALVRAVVEAGVAVPPTDETACREIYRARPERFVSPTLYEAAHILLPAANGDTAACEAARALADALLEELRRSPSAFDRLAVEHSACPSREAGGRLGQIASGDTVPEFEAALDGLAPGEIAPEPVATRFGLHIIRLDARAPGSVLPYDAVAPQIREMLEKQAWALAAKAFVGSLVAKADIDGIDFPTQRSGA